MDADGLSSAIASVPAGRWAVGVSGGADSVALLALLRARTDLTLHVVHLNHQTRGVESDGDAEFVCDLAIAAALAFTIATREEVEAGCTAFPANPSARYRAARLALFRQVVAREGLLGVILAHHADDQAETIMLRLLRGSGISGLSGMAQVSMLGGMSVCRPLLDARRESLRGWLREMGQAWREDPSNTSDHYLRNRVRRVLAITPALVNDLLLLGVRCRAIRQWFQSHAPTLATEFTTRDLSGIPRLLGMESAREWLAVMGVPRDELDAQVIDRLLRMSRDAASPARAHFPGAVLVRRRKGVISAENSVNPPAD